MPEPIAPGAGTQRASKEGGAATPQRILVLGAGGFIGQQVVRALALGGWARPVAAVHHKRPVFPATIETVALDARRPDALQTALRGVAGVVNCIAGDAATITATARTLFDACAGPAAPRVIHLSTMMVYGTQTGTIDETAALRGDWDDYSRAKADVESLALACPTVVCLRPGIVYGPQSPIWSGWIGQWLCAGRLGDLGATGSGCCNLVHVDDVVTAVLRSLRTTGIEGQAFNLSQADPPTWNEYFRQFAAALGCPFVSISRTRLAMELYLLAPPLKALQIIAGKLRLDLQPAQPIRPWLPRLCSHAVRLDVRKAEHLLGMEWTPLERGLREAVAWLRRGTRTEPVAAPAR
jgi:nucleoside-diphosphate-sugar epimerase